MTRERRTLLSFSLLGVGAASAVAASVMLGVGLSQGNTAHEQYLRSTALADISRHREDVDSARTTVIVGGVAAGLALASAGTAIVLLLTRPPDPRDSQPLARTRAAPGLTVGIHLRPEGGLAGVQGCF